MKIYSKDYAAACYFRTIADSPNKKCLLQLTEKCNLHCKHCFVSADYVGEEMDFASIKNTIIPQLKEYGITKITLTGGEPFVYSKLYEVICLLDEQNIEVSVCTNALLVTNDFLDKIGTIDKIHFNVSLDGFSVNSHGKFRGGLSQQQYDTIISNIRMLGSYKLLNGVLVTPNNYSSIKEYIELCQFAKECGAKYVLMNPLSEYGRGEKNITVAYSNEQMEELQSATERFNSDEMEMVYIRFPNREGKALGPCVAGKIIYIFADGKVAYCPYLVFAARNNSSRYDEKEFLVGNIYEKEFDLRMSMEEYVLPVKSEEVCKECNNSSCQKGCYAVKIAQGCSLESRDEALCPMRK